MKIVYKTPARNDITHELGFGAGKLNGAGYGSYQGWG